MASLATILNRFVGVAELAEIKPAVWTRADSCRLRPLPNEDVYLFVKRIDNSAVIRAADPAARRARSRSAFTGFAAAALIIAGLIPAAYNTMAGFHIESLRAEQTRLKQQAAALELEEAGLLSPQRLEKMAKSLKMMEPAPTSVEYLSGTVSDAQSAKMQLPANLLEAAKP